MNKTQLIEQLKKPEDKVNLLLSEAGISNDLEVYTDDHLTTIKAINEILESGKAETYKDAAKLYRASCQTLSETEEAAQPANNLDKFILSLANQSADATFSSLPNIAIEEYQRLKALFMQQYRQRIIERLQDPEFQQQFQAAMEGGQDMGKLKLLSSTTSNTALLNSSSSSN